ncbi:MAG: tRNA pseudouridine(55) synthase TruB [Oscillospiraceae bacterium]|nr:tRNA pseudouridine(55) synthase TruB [Oscillospiraceae bacterium]MDD4413272.1 tRNA pseudouridine(55) synthase TruB [Oscillospiraceae bacterium]
MSVNGVICLDKPQEITSFVCCSIFRRLLGTRKIGHAGTLDPMATGVLPLLVGRATRFLELLPMQDKRYTATLRFGFTSDTQDIWGSVAAFGGSLPSLRDIEQMLPSFRGDILQIPPMMSAIKRDGVRLYDLARQGIEIERPPRPVTVYSLEIMDYNPEKGELTLDCHCSKGTYIRTICADLGERLGCGAVMISLRRTMAAGFTLEQCITLDQARELAEKGMLENILLPVESIFDEYDSLTVSPAQAKRFQNGGSLFLDRLNRKVTDITKVYSPDNEFIGLGKPEDGELKILILL